MRRTIALMAGSALVVALLPAATAAAEPQDDPARVRRNLVAVDAEGQVAPKGAKAERGVNPYSHWYPIRPRSTTPRWKSVGRTAQSRPSDQQGRRRPRWPPAASPLAGRRGRAGRHPRLQRHPGDRTAGARLRHRRQAEQPRRGSSARSTPEVVTRTTRVARTPRTTARSRWPATPASAAAATASPPPARSATARTAVGRRRHRRLRLLQAATARAGDSVTRRHRHADRRTLDTMVALYDAAGDDRRVQRRLGRRPSTACCTYTVHRRPATTTSWSPASSSCRPTRSTRPAATAPASEGPYNVDITRRPRPTSTSTRSSCARATCSAPRSTGSADRHRRSTTRPVARCTAPTRTPRSSTRRHRRCPAAATRSPTTWPTTTAGTTSRSASGSRRLRHHRRGLPAGAGGQRRRADAVPGLRRRPGQHRHLRRPGRAAAEPAARVPRPVGPDQRRRERR